MVEVGVRGLELARDLAGPYETIAPPTLASAAGLIAVELAGRTPGSS